MHQDNRICITYCAQAVSYERQFYYLADSEGYCILLIQYRNQVHWLLHLRLVNLDFEVVSAIAILCLWPPLNPAPLPVVFHIRLEVP